MQIDPDVLERIRQIDLLSYLREFEPSNLVTQGSLSMAIYEYFSSRENEENVLSKQYNLSYHSWKKLIEYGISRNEFKQVDIKGVFDIILFTYQGVRMYSQLMPIPNETPERIIEQIKLLLLNKKTEE